MKKMKYVTLSNWFIYIYVREGSFDNNYFNFFDNNFLYKLKKILKIVEIVPLIFGY